MEQHPAIAPTGAPGDFLLRALPPWSEGKTNGGVAAGDIKFDAIAGTENHGLTTVTLAE